MMSDELLSQAEIDALLAAIDADSEEDPVSDPRFGSSGRTPWGHASARAKPYDFLRPDKFSKDQLRTLQMMHESFARTLQSSLSGYLRTNVEVAIVGVEEMMYEEFTRRLTNPTIFTILSLQPVAGTAILELSPNIGIALLDRLLGGPGTMPLAPRALTDIERTVFRRIIDRVVYSLEDAWKQVADLNVAFEGIEMNPQFTQLVPAKDMTVVIQFHIALRDAVGSMNLLLPYATLEPFASQLKAQVWFASSVLAPNQEQQGEIRRRLASIRLPVVAELGGTSVTVGEFLDLEPGDVVELDSGRAGLLKVKVGTRVKFHAKPGRVGKRLAVELVSVIEQEDD